MNLCNALEVSSDYILYGKKKIDYEDKIAETIGKISTITVEKR